MCQNWNFSGGCNNGCNGFQNWLCTGSFWNIYLRRKYNVNLSFADRMICIPVVIGTAKRFFCKSTTNLIAYNSIPWEIRFRKPNQILFVDLIRNLAFLFRIGIKTGLLYKFEIHQREHNWTMILRTCVCVSQYLDPKLRGVLLLDDIPKAMSSVVFLFTTKLDPAR